MGQEKEVESIKWMDELKVGTKIVVTSSVCICIGGGAAAGNDFVFHHD